MIASAAMLASAYMFILVCAAPAAQLKAAASTAPVVPVVGGGMLCGGACADHMVLDRGNATVWGVGANTGTEIIVSLGPPTHVSDVKAGPWKAVVGRDGSWEVSLGIQQARTGSTLKISASDNSTVTLVDVAFGDVFLCGGQSNMWFPLNDIVNGTAVVVEGETLHGLRVMNVNHLSAEAPQSTLHWGRSWDGTGPCPHPNSCSSAGWSSMTSNLAASFSAVCYLAGRDIYRGLGGDVPIGLVETAWGGTRIEAWTSPDALAKCSGDGTAKCGLCCTDTNDTSGAGWCKKQQPKGSSACVRMNSTNSGNLCSAAYNGMMAPLLPMRFKAMIWCDN